MGSQTWNYRKFVERAAARAAAAGYLFAASVPTVAAQEPAEVLPETVVSASRIELPAEAVGSAVTVITGEDLDRRQVRILSDALRSVPGLAVSRSGPVGQFTQVGIRGAEGNHTLVLIDGIEVNDPSGGSEYDFAKLLNGNISRIEVLRGPQSALYGSDAIGGVISIVTRTPEPGLGATATAEAGSFATREGLVSLGYGGEGFYLSVFADRLKTDGVSVADADNGNGESDGHENSTIHFKAGIKPLPNLQLDVVAILVDAEADLDVTAEVVGAIDSGDKVLTYQRYGRVSGKLTLLDGLWEHLASAGSTLDDKDFLDAAGVQTFNSEGQKLKLDYQTNLFFETPDLAEAEHSLTFAVERETDRQFTDSAFSGPDRREVTNLGYVGEYRVDLWQRVFLSGGLRYDDNDALFDNATTYRVTGAYLHRETGTRLHGSYGTGIKNPTLFELFGFTPSFTGNPNLTPETSRGWDLGVEQSWPGQRARLDLTYFNNRITDLIRGSGTSAINVPGTSRIHGLEIAAAAEFLPGLRLSGAYGYTLAEDGAGNELIRRAKHIASLNADYEFALFDRPAGVTLGIAYNGRQKDSVFFSFFPVDTREVTLGSYTLVNLGLSYELGDGFEVFARGENLLNQNYQEVFGFGAPGISGFAGLRVKFGFAP